jgi:hypothetical protein
VSARLEKTDTSLNRVLKKFDATSSRKDKLVSLNATKTTRAVPIPDAAKTIKYLCRKSAGHIKPLDALVERVSTNDINYI